MADPTLADVLAAVHRVDLQNQQQTALLAALTTGVQLMAPPQEPTRARDQA